MDKGRVAIVTGGGGESVRKLSMTYCAAAIGF